MATALSQLQDLRHGIDDGIAVDIPEWASNLLLSSMELSLTSLSDHGRLMLPSWEPHSPIWGFWEVKVGRMLSFVVIFWNLNLQTSRLYVGGQIEVGLPGRYQGSRHWWTLSLDFSIESKLDVGGFPKGETTLWSWFVFLRSSYDVLSESQSQLT